MTMIRGRLVVMEALHVSLEAAPEKIPISRLDN